jgi:cytochrome c
MPADRSRHVVSSRVVLLALPGAIAVAASVNAAAAQDPVKGKALFEQCAACHSLEEGKNGVGPSLHGLFGRKSASEDFVYSPAMRRANVTWTPELLDSYLANPQAGVFRGNRMPFAGIPDAQARADLIAYHKEAVK